MKDLNKIYTECLDMVRAAGYEPATPQAVIPNARATRRWGCVKWRAGKAKALEISTRLLEDSAPDYPVYNTMLHELAHLVAGYGEGHGEKWQAIARDLSTRYGYNITRTNGYQEYIKPAPKKWRCTCKKCGATFERDRRPSGYNRPGWTHKGCGGELSTWERNEEPEPVAPVANESKPQTVRFNGKVYTITK